MVVAQEAVTAAKVGGMAAEVGEEEGEGVAMAVVETAVGTEVAAMQPVLRAAGEVAVGLAAGLAAVGWVEAGGWAGTTVVGSVVGDSAVGLVAEDSVARWAAGDSAAETVEVD
jgi:hypothetical protein